MEDYGYYRNDNFPLINHNIYFTDSLCIFYLVVNIVTFLVGVLGNGLVIWITGFKMKKTVNTTWYLSLAVSDFIFCAVFPPFYIILIVTEECVFGLFMCNFTFVLIFIPMISSVFLMVIINVDHCVSVVFPVCITGSLVIWITGLKMKKTVNTTWYLSLAVSDFIFCVTYLPVYIVHFFNKMYFTFALIFITMFSSVFLLVIISVDHCVSVVFPVWAHTNRTINKASIVVVLTWVSSAVLSTRFMFVGETDMHKILVCHFFGGFAMPFLIIFFCYSVTIPRLITRQMMSVSSKSLRVMTAVIAMYFICWLPFYFTILSEGSRFFSPEVVRNVLMVGVAFATVHSFLRPVLYVCMGNNVPPRLKWSIVDRIENVLGEEDPPTTTSHETSTHL